jgi:hypothetical protein
LGWGRGAADLREGFDDGAVVAGSAAEGDGGWGDAFNFAQDDVGEGQASGDGLGMAAMAWPARRAGNMPMRPDRAATARRRGARRATPERVLAAARIKPAHPIAFADCFAAATTAARRAVLYPGDPELLEREVGCRTRDLRPR